MKHYLRGQLANAARLNKETLRYYENNGLIPPAQRDSNGYRSYPAETLVLLEFISVAKAAGFTLKEIKELFSALHGEEFQKEQLESIIVKKLADIDETQKALNLARERLLDMSAHLDSPLECPVFEACQILDQQGQTRGVEKSS